MQKIGGIVLFNYLFILYMTSTSFKYFLGGKQIYVQDDVNNPNSAYLYLENEATEENHAINLKTLRTTALSLQKQIQHAGGYVNSYWVTEEDAYDISYLNIDGEHDGDHTNFDGGAGNEATDPDGNPVSRIFYKSIEDAVNAAVASDTSDNYDAHIYIQSGFYTVSSTINIPNETSNNAVFDIKIIGEGQSGEVILDLTTDGTGSFSLSGTSNSVVFENITFKYDSSASSIMNLTAQNVIIKNCIFEHNASTPVNNPSIVINGYLFEGGTYLDNAIASDRGQIHITNCNFKNNSYTPIEITYGNNIQIKNNTFQKSTSHCIHLIESYQTIIENNTVLSCDGCGIYLDTCFKTTILSNHLHNIGYSAFYVNKSPHTMIQNNIMNFINYNKTTLLTNENNASIVIDISDTTNLSRILNSWINALSSYTGPSGSQLPRSHNTVAGPGLTLYDSSGTVIDSNALNGLNNSYACIFTNNTLNRGGSGDLDTQTYANRVIAFRIELYVDMPVIINNFTASQPFYITTGDSVNLSYLNETEPGFAQLIHSESTDCTLCYNSCLAFGYNVQSVDGEEGSNLMVLKSS